MDLTNWSVDSVHTTASKQILYRESSIKYKVVYTID